MNNVYIGLGSNLQNPKEQLIMAIQTIAYLPNCQIIKQSSWYCSDSILEGQPSYINAVICIETTYTPLELLDTLQAIEIKQGRERKERWGARTLDLDILLFENFEINEPRLNIPHPQLEFRSFVLYPLLEINKSLKLPDGRSIQQLTINCPSLNLKKL